MAFAPSGARVRIIDARCDTCGLDLFERYDSWQTWRANGATADVKGLRAIRHGIGCPTDCPGVILMATEPLHEAEA